MKTISLADGLIVDITDEQHEELEKWSEESKEWPRKGDDYWYVSSYGELYLEPWWANDSDDNGRKKQGNVYKTKEEAEMGAIRDRAFRVKNTAKKGEKFWVWDFYNLAYCPMKHDSGYWNHWPTQPKFATEDEASSWGGEYDGSIKFFNK